MTATSRHGRIKPGLLAIGAMVLLPLIGLLASGFGNDPNALPSMLESSPAPPFSLVDLNGKTVELADLRGGPVVLNFWSTWCGPCKYEHPLLQQAQRQYPDVTFLGIIYSDKPDNVRRYLVRKPSVYSHLVDNNNRVAIDYGVTGVPETFFIDRAGIIVHKAAGPLYPALLEDQLAGIRR